MFYKVDNSYDLTRTILYNLSKQWWVGLGLGASLVKTRDDTHLKRPIKTILHNQLPSKMLICTKILIIEPSSDEIKYT